MKNCKNCHYYRKAKNKCIRLNKQVISILSCKNFISKEDTKTDDKSIKTKKVKTVMLKHYFLK